MKSANVAELRNRLSHYLRAVRRGEPLLVRDRDRVIARIEPAGDEAATDDEGKHLEELELRGVLRRGRGRITKTLLARRCDTGADVVGAVLREREEGR
jgi:antitoxin (DNA-binding transcriptional repressor) of toxin-antitoxin stability system